MRPPRISAPPRERRLRYSLSRLAQIHYLSTQHLKPLRRKRFSEEVRIVVLCTNPWNHDLLSLNHIADEEMSPRDVFRLVVMLRVI